MKNIKKILLITHLGLFIFLIDQSGSMEGKPIYLVKETLLLFIHSLPKKSYFQLYKNIFFIINKVYKYMNFYYKIKF